MLESLMTYVDTATAQWTEIEPGYRRMTLVNDRESGTRIVLLQYDAGYQLSYLDEHKHDEYLYVLSGRFVDQNPALRTRRGSVRAMRTSPRSRGWFWQA